MNVRISSERDWTSAESRALNWDCDAKHDQYSVYDSVDDQMAIPNTFLFSQLGQK